MRDTLNSTRRRLSRSVSSNPSTRRHSIFGLPLRIGCGSFVLDVRCREREDSCHDKHLWTTTEVKLAALELPQQLQENGVEDSLAEKSIRQLRNLCTQQHGLLTIKRVPIVHERNRFELEISLKGRGISTKGKNKNELVVLCEQNQIAITKYDTQIKKGWEGKPKDLLMVTIWKTFHLPARRMTLVRLIQYKFEAYHGNVLQFFEWGGNDAAYCQGDCCCCSACSTPHVPLA